MKLLRNIKARLGEFWWYSLLVFLACRSGDVIQAFIGLWLVPAKVSPDELGAVLPLQQFASVVALPLCILLAPLSRFLSIYAARGEYGKVKRLLQTAFYMAGLIAVVLFLAARFILVVPASALLAAAVPLNVKSVALYSGLLIVTS